MDSTPTVVFEATRANTRPLVVVLLLAATAGLAILVLESSSQRFIGLGVLIVCGGFALLATRRRGNVVAAVSEGIMHPHLGLIVWSDITEISVANSTIGRLLTIDVADRAVYERRQQSRSLRWLMRIDRVLRRPLLSLPQQFLTRDATELRDQLEARRAAANRR